MQVGAMFTGVAMDTKEPGADALNDMAPDPNMREYSNGEMTIIWKPSLCIHSGICARGLPRVFNPRRRPWVDQGAGTTEAMIAQVEKCPSRALSYRRDSAVEGTKHI